MGVPTFFRWLCVRYPKIIRDTIEREPVEIDGRMVPPDLDDDAPNGDFDNLYLDMNGIIHPCCHPEDGPAPEDEEHMYENIFLYLDRLFRIVRPKKLVYMAIDGVAPRAKMNQQRARRFRASQEREEMEREVDKLRQDWEAEGKTLPNKQKGHFFDSNVITPGSNFLHKMSEAIRYYIHDRTTNDPLWQKLKFRVILSDANIPGEGEHKVMQFIRLQRAQPEYNPNLRHCLYGADADLIMLGLATHEAHFAIIREVVIPKSEKKCTLCGGTGHVASECTGEEEEVQAEMGIQKPFQILSIPVLRQYLQLQFGELKERMPDTLPFDFERCIDDFVFMCFYVGNDFLPHLPSLNIRDGSIDQMLSLYTEILPSMENYLTDCGATNLPQVEQFLEYLGGIEDQVFKTRLEKEAKFRAEREDTKSREDKQAGGGNQQDSGGQMGGDLAGGGGDWPGASTSTSQGSDTNAWHAQLLAQSFSMDLEDVSAGESASKKPRQGSTLEPPKPPVRKQTGKIVDRDFHQTLRERLNNRQDLGEAMADTVRLGEGPHWKQRYYFEKFKIKQDDLVDFLQRIRKAYIEGLCWVLMYYYQGCASWTWFYPYHYAPFASDLIGCASLKCGELTYFQQGTPFQPFQQLMSVLPPSSCVEAGVPVAMRELMTQPFSPLIDFYPVDFGLDLNGKRFTWQAVVMLPFIDEPRLVRILAPLLNRISAQEKVRNRRGCELVFGHKDDKNLFHAVQLAQAAFEAGHAGLKQSVRGDQYLFGFLEGWQSGGGGRQVVSPIEGLPDVECSHCISAQFTDPDIVPHTSRLLPGITEMPLVVNAADMDEETRMKGFGGEPAKRMIMQALGKDGSKKRYQDTKHTAKTSFSDAKFHDAMASPVDEWSEETRHPAPPAGTKAFKGRGGGRGGSGDSLQAPAGFQSLRGPGRGGRAAPY